MCSVSTMNMLIVGFALSLHLSSTFSDTVRVSSFACALGLNGHKGSCVYTHTQMKMMSLNTRFQCLNRSLETTTRTPWWPPGWTAPLRHQTQWTLMPKGGPRSQRPAHTASPSPSRTHTLDWGWHALHISIPTVAFTTPAVSTRETVSFVSSRVWMQRWKKYSDIVHC